MPSTLLSTHHNSLVHDILTSWSQEEDDLVIITTDGSRVHAKQKILILHSPLLAKLLSSVRYLDTPCISVNGSLTEVEALLTLLSKGEAVSGGEDLGEGVHSLAASWGVGLQNIKITKNTNYQEIPTLDKSYSKKENYGNSNSSYLLQDTLTEKADNSQKITLDENASQSNSNKEKNVTKILELSNKCKQLVRRLSNLRKIKQESSESTDLKYRKDEPNQDENNLADNNFSIQNESQIMKCASCSQMFNSESKLKTHATCGTNFNRNICKKGFRFPPLLKIHISRCYLHNKDDCLICETKYTSAQYLREHCKKIHSRLGLSSTTSAFVSNNSILV